jgi:hypothetical protein
MDPPFTSVAPAPDLGIGMGREDGACIAAVARRLPRIGTYRDKSGVNMDAAALCFGAAPEPELELDPLLAADLPALALAVAPVAAALLAGAAPFAADAVFPLAAAAAEAAEAAELAAVLCDAADGAKSAAAAVFDEERCCA